MNRAFRGLLTSVAAMVLLTIASTARATWFDAAWPFRRSIDVAWDAEHGGDDGEIASAEFYTAGHSLPTGADLRVATEDGVLCPCRVIQSGPGDRVRIIFRLAKTVKRYEAYFGNPSPAAPPPNASPDFPIRYGLLMEVRGYSGGPSENFEQIERLWERGTPSYGAAMIDRPFIGYNPVTEADRTVARLTGSLFAPMDGDYFIAASCDDRGSLYIDSKPLIWIGGGPADTRFNAHIHLTRGRHDFQMFHLNFGGDMHISVGWKTPDAAKLDIIGRESFGVCPLGEVGPLQQIKHTLTADFRAEHLGEGFIHDPRSDAPDVGMNSQRYRFLAVFPQEMQDTSRVKVQWDFGDGQHADGPIAAHVFITPQLYPVRVTFHFGDTTDSQTSRFAVNRDPSTDDQPQDSSKEEAGITAGYDAAAMPPNWLPWALRLAIEARDLPAAVRVIRAMTDRPDHPDAALAFAAIEQTWKDWPADAPVDSLSNALADASPTSDLQPRIAKLAADVQLWTLADFAGAAHTLEPFASSHDPGVIRRRAMDMLLLGDAAGATKLLLKIDTSATLPHRAPLSGAMARSIESFVARKEVQAGTDAWDVWMTRFPSDFLQGYALLLRVRLIEAAGRPTVAAKVAEAFADAMPHSSYAPQLLDTASKLLAKSDPQKSQSLHTQLKQRYPEDPLAQ